MRANKTHLVRIEVSTQSAGHMLGKGKDAEVEVDGAEDDSFEAVVRMTWAEFAGVAVMGERHREWRRRKETDEEGRRKEEAVGGVEGDKEEAGKREGEEERRRKRGRRNWQNYQRVKKASLKQSKRNL